MKLNTINGPESLQEGRDNGINGENHEKELEKFTKEMGDKVYNLITGKIHEPKEKESIEKYFKNMTRNNYEEWMGNYLKNK